MREHDLQPRIRRRRTTTTDSDHDQPIIPNLAKDAKLDGPNQLWVAEPKEREAATSPMFR